MPGNSEFPTLQDYISLFPLDDMQPSKLMRLLSSNEEDATILSSPSECVARGWVAMSFPGNSLLPRLLCTSPQQQAALLAGQGVCGRGLSRFVSCGLLL